MSTRRSSGRRSASPEGSLDGNSRTRSPAIEDYESSDEENESLTYLEAIIAAIKSIIDPQDFQLIIIKKQGHLLKHQALMVKEMTRLARDISDIKDEIKTVRPELQGSHSTAQAASSNYSADIVISEEIYRNDMSKLISGSLLAQNQEAVGNWDFGTRIDSAQNKSSVSKILEHVLTCKQADIAQHAGNPERAQHWMVFDKLSIMAKIKSRFTYDKRAFSEASHKTVARLRATRRKNRRVHLAAFFHPLQALMNSAQGDDRVSSKLSIRKPHGRIQNDETKSLH
ncbi:hypothetical protein [Parasitella parasitica]|uniref:Uncharacterized protein n=1 Tax=Parasitella parasitica TaxID=35722 RepID=A0A0B7N4E7_9FUNG|nr:hypothetical protein [Parasitella parasitica]